MTPSVLPRLQTAYTELFKFAEQVEFNADCSFHRLGMMYLGQILETTYSIVFLSNSGSAAAQLILARHLFETIFRLHYLALNPRLHGSNLQIDDYLEQKKSLRQLLDIKQSKSITEKLKFVDSQIAKLKAAGAEQKNFFEIIKAVASEQNYLMYRRLSASVHSQEIGLSHQFLESTSSGLKITLFKELSTEQITILNTTIADLCNTAHIAVSQIVQSEIPG